MTSPAAAIPAPRRGVGKPVSATRPRGATYVRFRTAQRLEHVLLIVSFTLLAVTGLPQKVQPSAVSDALVAAFGGIEWTRKIHHAAAIVLVAQSIYHIAEVLYRRLVHGTRLSMLPGWQDFRDFAAAVRYGLGLRKQSPNYGRYTYAEKVEYWALVWGTVIMALTGFMLWNPIAATRWLPGEAIPAAKAAHGGEALLAVLSILLWHFYHVHVKSLNKSMFTGRLSEREMAHEHPAELALIRSGNAPREFPPAQVDRRQKVIFPLVSLVGGALFVGLYFLTTGERTAVASPPTSPDRAAVMQVATATPAPTRVPATATLVPTVAPTATARVLRFETDVLPILQDKCAGCHAQAPSGQQPPSHPAASAPVAAPASPASSAAPAAPAAPAPAAPAPASALGKPIPHSIAGQQSCLACHSAGPLAVPASHAGRPETTCQDCHKPS